MQDSASATDRGDLLVAAEDWLSHRPMNSAVPLSAGVAELRYRCPQTKLGDQELELLLAEMALKRGLAICFDGKRDGASSPGKSSGGGQGLSAQRSLGPRQGVGAGQGAGPGPGAGHSRG